ncbi:uncharacterized protein J8A68_004237 [[Candida] subhashii]|uniref:Agglutinin-like protein N-terminal domain-containing protein n=1 Tax=[Candida] subhashii TaxID=561895 RepID=A0A8J5QK94_9ASCO|nr:uncharacterized protein J8A68_004237 [[Candida] subhashii]KAG7662227.1 hypothetical protein J8A68_004237 [[Candida] subhashii]
MFELLADSVVFKKAATAYDYAAPSYPNWIATLSWEMKGGDIVAGDTFDLTLPCVFKFTATQDYVDLKVQDTVYARCYFQPGDIVVSYSRLECEVANAIRPETDASGKINFPFTFNSGRSHLETDLRCASFFHIGNNVISFLDGSNQLQTTASFEGDNKSEPEKILYSNRVIPSLNKQQHSVAAGKCSEGHTSGKIGFKVLSEDVTIDCDSQGKGLAKDFNDWYFPMDSSELSTTSLVCNGATYEVSFENIPSGYTPFLSVLMKVKFGTSVSVYYTSEFKCRGSKQAQNYSRQINWSPYSNDTPGGNGQDVIVTTTTYYGSTTLVTTLPYSEGVGFKTIVVKVPIPTVTTTTTWEKTYTSVSTVSATPGETATEIYQVPDPNATIPNPSTKPSTAPEDETTNPWDEPTSTETNESDDEPISSDPTPSDTNEEETTTAWNEETSTETNESDDEPISSDPTPSDTNEEETTTAWNEETSTETNESDDDPISSDPTPSDMNSEVSTDPEDETTTAWNEETSTETNESDDDPISSDPTPSDMNSEESTDPEAQPTTTLDDNTSSDPQDETTNARDEETSIETNAVSASEDTTPNGTPSETTSEQSSESSADITSGDEQSSSSSVSSTSDWEGPSPTGDEGESESEKQSTMETDKSSTLLSSEEVQPPEKETSTTWESSQKASASESASESTSKTEENPQTKHSSTLPGPESGASSKIVQTTSLEPTGPEWESIDKTKTTKTGSAGSTGQQSPSPTTVITPDSGSNVPSDMHQSSISVSHGDQGSKGSSNAPSTEGRISLSTTTTLYASFIEATPGASEQGPESIPIYDGSASTVVLNLCLLFICLIV